MTDEIKKQMEFRPDPDMPDVFIIDGIKISGAYLREITQPDPKQFLSFKRKRDQVQVTRIDLQDEFQQLKNKANDAREDQVRAAKGEAMAMETLKEVTRDKATYKLKFEEVDRRLKEAIENTGRLEAGFAKATSDLLDERNNVRNLEKEIEIHAAAQVELKKRFDLAGG